MLVRQHGKKLTLYPSLVQAHTMSLELIIGPMFSGKTSALLSIIRRHEALGLKCVAFKPQLDDRYEPDHDTDNHDTYYIYNHDRVKAAALSVTYLTQAARATIYDDASLVIVEEGQFFKDLYEFVLKAVEVDKKHVIVAGLDGDRFRKPFGQILQLIPIADRITKLTSLCKLCANDSKAVPALFSYGNTKSEEIVQVGDGSIYMPLCRQHYLEITSEN